MKNRFEIWKEHSRTFNTDRYNVYDGGSHAQGFETLQEALMYVKQLEEIQPRENQVVYTQGNCRIVKYFSYIFVAYRYAVEVRRTVSYSTNTYWSFDSHFETHEAAHNWLVNLDANYNCVVQDPIQVYPWK